MDQPPLHADETRAHGLGVMMADPIPEPIPVTLDDLRAILGRLIKENNYLRKALDDALGKRIEGA